MPMRRNVLYKRRRTTDRTRNAFETNGLVPEASDVSQDILHSWKRSSESVEAIRNAPLNDEAPTKNLWEESPLSVAMKCEHDTMLQLASEGHFVAAIADPMGRLLWTHASRHMRDRAEALNFTAGGNWNEQVVGTNAVGLSLKLRRPVTVFSSEHYLPFVQDWVCYAAPIIHPFSGECVGALDISTTWNKHTPLGQSATTQLALSIGQNLPRQEPRVELEIYALGQPRVLYQGRSLHLPPRHLEILCLLALNPDGLSLHQLHAALYGDAKVSTATLKSDVSHLRQRLNGQISSRPYRLTMSVSADFTNIWEALANHQVNEAVAAYRGALLPNSQSPELEQWRYCIDAAMSRSIETCQNPTQLFNGIERSTSGSTLVRDRLLDLLSG